MERRKLEAERRSARETSPADKEADAVKAAAGEALPTALFAEAAPQQDAGQAFPHPAQSVSAVEPSAGTASPHAPTPQGQVPGSSVPCPPKGKGVAELLASTESEAWLGEADEDEESLDSDAYFYATDYDPQQEAIRKLEAEERLAEAVREQERRARIEAMERARQQDEESEKVHTDLSTAVGKLRRRSSLSISISPPTSAASAPAEAPPQERLTLALLEGYWESMLAAMKEQYPQLAEHLGVAKLEWVDEDNFVIVVQSSFAESEIKPYLVRILTYLRRKSVRGLLNATIRVVHVERKTVAYMPQEKFELMASANPVLNTFRVIFPEVDY